MNSALSAASERAARIQAFRDELAQLEVDRILVLTDEQRWRLRRYHEALLRPLLLEPVPSAPVPIQVEEVRPGPWIATGGLWTLLLLAATWAWDAIPMPLQLLALLVTPFGLLVATQLAARSETKAAWVSPLGLSSFAALAATVVMSTRSLGVPFEGPLGLALGWGFAAAYAYHSAPVLAAVGLATGLSSSAWLQQAGFSWAAPFERPETLFPAGILLLLVSALPHRRRPHFPPTYRLLGLAFLFLPMALLSNWGAASVVAAPPEEIQALYRGIGGSAAALTALLGFWLRRRGTAYTGLSFFALFLYSGLVAWWWQRVSTEAFFAGAAVLALAIPIVALKLQGSKKAAA